MPSCYSCCHHTSLSFHDLGRRQWQPTPVLLPGQYHGWCSLVGCSPWGRYESGTTERLHFHFSLSYIGEGNGNPLQCSCLENPRDGGAWWAAIHRVTKSQTQLKRLSSQELVMDREPGVLPSMESQRAGHDSASKQQREQPTYLFSDSLEKMLMLEKTERKRKGWQGLE